MKKLKLAILLCFLLTTATKAISNEIIDVDTGTSKGFVVTKSGEYYGFGENIYYALDNKIEYPITKIATNVAKIQNGAYLDNDRNLYVVTNDINNPYKKIASSVKSFEAKSSEKLVYITMSNELWGYGVEYASEFGRGEYKYEKPVSDNGFFLPKSEQFIPLYDGITHVKIADNVRMAHAGYYTTSYVTTDNKGYILGENTLATPKSTDKVYTKPFLYMSDVKELTLTSDNIFTLKTDNTLWFEGHNVYGNSTLDEQRSKILPKTKILDNVKTIAYTGQIMGVIKTDNALYTWGDNLNLKLGYAIDGYYSTKPTKVLDNVQEVSLEGISSMALTYDGKTYVWGTLRKGNIPFTSETMFKLPAQIDFANEKIIPNTNDNKPTDAVVDGNQIKSPSWIKAEDYVIFKNDELYTSANWAKIITYREQVVNKTIKMADIEKWYNDSYTKKTDALNYELLLIYDKVYIDSNFTNNDAFSFAQNKTSKLPYGPKQVSKIKEQYVIMGDAKANRKSFTAQVKTDERFENLLQNNQQVTKKELLSHKFFDVYKSNPQFVTFINSPIIRIDGNFLFINPYSEVINGSTMIPLRTVTEAISAIVTWDEKTKTATITYAGKTIKLTIGDEYAYINGVAEKLPVKTYTSNWKMYIPLRFVSEHFGQKVAWDNIGLITIDANNDFLENNTTYKFMESMTKAFVIDNYLTHERSLDFTKNRRNILSEWWGVYNRQDLIEQIVYMTDNEYQNYEFFEEYNDLRSKTEAQLADIRKQYEDGYMVDQILAWGNKWGKTGVVSYDLTRVVLLAEWGYNSGYLTLEESIAISKPVVEQYQKTFTNWEDSMQNYIDGYAWFSRTNINKEGTEYKDRIKKFEYSKKYGKDLFDNSLFTAKIVTNTTVTYDDLKAEIL